MATTKHFKQGQMTGETMRAIGKRPQIYVTITRCDTIDRMQILKMGAGQSPVSF